ncbi:SusC/RagA family TonB-linked outer membrane protein [Sphingobacterium sp. DN00404]|uniref:SusC/RagA family TonB-linked outer membrane protein n=1 Tax=Sphingobacterium micropteri TaxID=2763501 RepID=A0ABR7YQX6_9SPHI|nr:SusC/RagA family TonB-linked outer membrane protein [Sphingobacterium micropteri]MBD1433763.1 SusC/RagA family TonB-linked outer membrane protein [Sphingobacterium micropteri]
MRVVCFVIVMILSGGLCQAQENSVQWIEGTVLSKEDRSPIQNATVFAKEADIGVSTEKNGKFRIRVNSLKDSLGISSIGFQNIVVVASFFENNSTVFLLADKNTLEEVVVETGYQQLRSGESTGAAEVLDKEMLNIQTGTNILDRLNNMASSVRFDNQPIENADLQKLNISVRGLSTINGARDPLIVLDGFIYEGDINNIDPNSIESVSILKDAAASAIWGARAGNGVIVMTSKKGTLGAESTTKVSVNNTLIWKERPDLEKLYQLNNRDFIGIEEMLFNTGFYDRQLSRTPYMAVTPAIEIFHNRRSGMISVADSADMIERLMLSAGRGQYIDNFIRTPFTNQHALSINGGSGKHAYGFGLGYTGDRNENDAGNRKLNVQLSNSFKPTDKLQMDVLILYTNQHEESGKPALSNFTYGNKTVPYMSFFDEDGLPQPFEKEYRRSYMQEMFSEGYLDWDYYPLVDYRYSRTNRQRNEWFASFRTQYRIAPFLDANVAVQYQNQRSERIILDEQESYFARTYINQFMQVDPNTGATTYPVPLGGIRNSAVTNGASYTLRGQLNFNKVFADHKIVGMLGVEARENKISGENVTAYGYNESPLIAIPVDYVTSYRLAPSNSSRTIAGTPGFSRLTNRFVSAYTNWNYVWKQRYGASVSFRQDGANIFGAATNDRWSPLWSVGAFWDVTREEFMKIDWLDHLKLRLTYGYSGNVDLRKTPEPVANIGGSIYTNYPGQVIGTLNDPNLRWEKVGTSNVGLDFSFLNNRIHGTMDYFIKNGKDLYGLSEYDYTVWGLEGTITKNVARMQTKGWDLVVNTRNLNEKLKWDTRLVLNMNKSKTVDYYNSLNMGLASFLGNGNMISPIVGKPLYALAGYRWMGLDEEGNPQGILNGEPSKEYNKIRTQSYQDPETGGSIRYFGSAKPEVFGSIMNTFAYQNVSIAINISYRGGYFFNRPVTWYNTLYNRGTAYPDFEQRWIKSGDEQYTNVPSVQYPLDTGRDAFYANSEINVLRADHLRLEFVSLQWNPQLKLSGRTYDFRLYTNVNNLGLLWTLNSEGIDPEFPYQITPPRTYSLGFQFDF